MLNARMRIGLVALAILQRSPTAPMPAAPELRALPVAAGPECLAGGMAIAPQRASGRQRRARGWACTNEPKGWCGVPSGMG